MPFSTYFLVCALLYILWSIYLSTIYSAPINDCPEHVRYKLTNSCSFCFANLYSSSSTPPSYICIFLSRNSNRGFLWIRLKWNDSFCPFHAWAHWSLSCIMYYVLCCSTLSHTAYWTFSHHPVKTQENKTPDPCTFFFLTIKHSFNQVGHFDY